MEAEYGTFTISRAAIVAGSITRLDLAIRIGKEGVPEGGLIRIEFAWGCWTPPVMAEMKVHIYLQNVNARVIPQAKDKKVELLPRVWYRGVVNPFVSVRVVGGSLVEGDTVVFQYGLPNPQLTETRCQTYPVDSVNFRVRVNLHGDDRRQWFDYQRKSELRILPGPPRRLEVLLPSIAAKDEEIRVRYVLTDMYRNQPEEEFREKITFELVDGKALLPATPLGIDSEFELSGQQAGILRIGARGPQLASAAEAVIPIVKGSTLDYLPLPRREGVDTAAPPFELPQIWLRKAADLAAISNPMRILDGKARYRIFWGDLHVHTKFSDGEWDIDRAYRYSRDVVKLDIVATGDHETGIATSDTPFGRRRPRPPLRWEQSQEAANRFYEPGRLVTFRGFEWTSNNFGHRNVYFPDGQTEGYLATLDSDYINYEMRPAHFYEVIGRREAIIIPHHTLVATDWSYYDPREILVEIYSTWGRTEYSGNVGWDKPDNPKGGALEGLGRGYRLGFIGGSDGHDSAGGRCYPGPPARNLDYRSGLMAVLAEELTRESVYAALKARRTYATTGERIYLNFTVDGALMGSDIERDAASSIEIAPEVAGTRPLRRIDLVRDGEVLESASPENDWAEYRWNVRVPSSGQTSYIYLRAEQTDGNIAWASPVWITGR